MKKRMNKSGQLAVFIIVAIVIVIGVGVFYTIEQKKTRDANIEYFSDTQIKSSVDVITGSFIECLKQSSSNALDLIGDQGGYFSKPKRYLDFGLEFIPYYYYTGEVIIPTKANVQMELAKAVNSQLVKCVGDVDKSGFEFIYKKPFSRVFINETHVKFKVDLPITIKKEDKTIVFETKEHEIVLDSELYAILSLSDYYAKSHKSDPKMFCISCIGEMAEKNDLYVDILDLSKDTTLVLISENHTSNMPYFYQFLNKYRGDEKSPSVNDSVPPRPVI